MAVRLFVYFPLELVLHRPLPLRRFISEHSSIRSMLAAATGPLRRFQFLFRRSAGHVFEPEI